MYTKILSDYNHFLWKTRSSEMAYVLPIRLHFGSVFEFRKSHISHQKPRSVYPPADLDLNRQLAKISVKTAFYVRIEHLRRDKQNKSFGKELKVLVFL